MTEKGVKFPETIEEVMLDPHRYGMPTLEEFSKDPSKWKNPSEYLLEQVDKGSKILTSGFKKYTFEIAGYRCVSLEEVQFVATCEGLDWATMEIKPMVIPGSFGESRIHVKFEQRKLDSETKIKTRR